jgi:hypothetical protein
MSSQKYRRRGEHGRGCDSAVMARVPQVVLVYHFWSTGMAQSRPTRLEQSRSVSLSDCDKARTDVQTCARL